MKKDDKNEEQISRSLNSEPLPPEFCNGLDSDLNSNLYSKLRDGLNSELYRELDSEPLPPELRNKIYSKLRDGLNSEIFKELEEKRKK